MSTREEDQKLFEIAATWWSEQLIKSRLDDTNKKRPIHQMFKDQLINVLAQSKYHYKVMPVLKTDHLSKPQTRVLLIAQESTGLNIEALPPSTKMEFDFEASKIFVTEHYGLRQRFQVYPELKNS